MSHICKQRSIANDWKLIQGMKVISKRRRKKAEERTAGRVRRWSVLWVPHISCSSFAASEIVDSAGFGSLSAQHMSDRWNSVRAIRRLNWIRTLMRASKAWGLPLAWKYFLANARMADSNCSVKYKDLSEPNHKLRHHKRHHRYGYSPGSWHEVSRGSKWTDAQSARVCKRESSVSSNTVLRNSIWLARVVNLPPPTSKSKSELRKTELDEDCNSDWIKTYYER